jgi:nitrogen fixation NifU-like protein
MSDLSDLYQELIIDHNKKPRNCGTLEHANRHAEGYNPLCGDRIDVYLEVEDDIVKDIKFQGSGCAISTASASLMTQSVKGRSVCEAKQLFELFHRLIIREHGDDEHVEELGKLAVFSGVNQYPARVKCATLAWHTVKAALDKESTPVSTE